MKPKITPQMALYNEGDKINRHTLRKIRQFQADPATRARMLRIRRVIHLLSRAGVQAADRRYRAAKEAS
jgi:hypothetical protein